MDVTVLEVPLSEEEYQLLRSHAARLHLSPSQLCRQAIATYLDELDEENQSLYADIQAKQRRFMSAPPLSSAARQSLRLELLYHSEALEGSSLTKEDIQEAVKTLG